MVIKKEKEFNKIKLKESEKGITLIALVITILLRYDDIRKYSNNSKFLLPINC